MAGFLSSRSASAADDPSVAWQQRWDHLSRILTSLDYYRDTLNAGAPGEGHRFVIAAGEHGDRSQTVYVRRGTMGEDPTNWMLIEAPFARLDEISPAAALEAVETFPIGALGRLGDLLTLRDSIELQTPTDQYTAEVGRLIGEVGRLADVFEQHFLGGDRL